LHSQHVEVLDTFNIIDPVMLQSEIHLLNGRIAKLIFGEFHDENYISQAIMDLLSILVKFLYKMTFVEFHRRFKTQILKYVEYFDGVWAPIQPSDKLCIRVDKEWMLERRAMIDHEKYTCNLKPPHLKSWFCFPKSPTKVVENIEKATEGPPVV